MTQALEQPRNQQQAGDNGGNAMAKRSSFQPLAPIGSAGTLKNLLESQRNGIAQALPKHITPERLIKTLLVAANRNPDILKCTQASVIETLNRAAELGLDLSGTLGEAYPVPFNNKVKYKDENGRDREEYLMQLTLIIGYRGFEKLAWQSGMVDHIDAEVVCKNDRFSFKKGTTVTLDWSPCLDGDRGEIVGAYACVGIKGGGKLARFLPASDLEKIRSASKSKDSPAWRNWKDEMYRKCALKRTLKDAPLSTEKYVRAMEHDDSDLNLADVLEAETTRPRGAGALVDKLKNRQLPDIQVTEEEANRILESRAGRSVAPSPGDDSASPLVSSATASNEPSHADGTADDSSITPESTQAAPGGEGGNAAKLPDALPEHARNTQAWIDDLIPQFKPQGVSNHAARNDFHKQHAPHSWAKLPHEEQDAMYETLKRGEAFGA